MPTHVILMEAANIFTEVVSQATVASLRLHILPKPAQMDQFCSSFELQAREPKTLTLLVTKWKFPICQPQIPIPLPQLEEIKVMFKKAKMRGGENVAHLESPIPVSLAYCGLILWISEGFY